MPEMAADLADVVLDPPDRTFSETAYVDVGDRRVELRHIGLGHTDHDIVIKIPDAAVTFAGDLIENGAVPAFGDAYPLDWPETASRLAELVVRVVVPGHGDHAGRAFVEEQAGALAALAELSRRVHRRELSIDDALALTPFPAYPAEDIRRPIQRALAQLEGKLV
jgi:glyoxylase-like metal-dependent hydrolase (beta-lactamase superfamily II)